MIDCVLNEKMPSLLRAAFANLLITLHLDKDPLEKLVVPIMTRVWHEIEEGSLAVDEMRLNDQVMPWTTRMRGA